MTKSVIHDPMFKFLAVLSIASAVGLQTWRTLFNNFAVEVVHLGGNHVGIIQSIREIPGFLALLAIFIIIFIKEHRLSALSIVTLGIGVGITGLLPSYQGLILTTLIMSFGFHYYETTNNSLTLQYFDQNTSPWVIGKLRSFGAATNIAVGLFIFVVTAFLDYRMIYGLVGVVIVVAGLWGLSRNPTRVDIVPQHKKMIFRRKYWLYYFLTFMAGARRQIFVAFAVFLLVLRFEFSVREITILFIINNVINYFLSPLIGKAIIRFGERKVLSLEYLSLIFIFIAYATTDSRIVVMVLYVLDHIFFNFSMGIRTFFQKIGDPRDIAPSMAVGFTINHIAAVIIPALGGLLWIIDYRIVFLAGAAMSAISLLAVQWISHNIRSHNLD
ncbi:MAG: MFS transporter [Candidatus Marinimicrobia bacterium]|nr:MFS transporter [Candidatus Neomarinimicrobiota bacterium]